MNTPEENITAATCEEQEIQERREIRRSNLKWAREWHDGNAQCPCCTGTEFDIVDLDSEGRTRYETFRCKANACRTRWRIEFRETALIFLQDDTDREDDWIELKMFDRPPGVPITAGDHYHGTFSECETATILAALRYWQREGSMSAGYEQDIATDFDRLKPLSAEEVDALCERINCRDDGR